MANCKYCGNWMPDTAMQCSVCGRRVPPPQPPRPASQPIHHTSRLPGQKVVTGTLGKGRIITDNLGKGSPIPQPPIPPVPPAAPIPEPPAKKKNGLIIGLSIFLGIALLALLGLGGWWLWSRSQAEDPNVGRYAVVSRTRDGEDIPTDGEWLELREGGQVKIRLSEERMSGKWKLKGEALTITAGGETYTGVLEDQQITIELGGCVYVFSKEASGGDEDPEPEAQEHADPSEEPQPGPQPDPETPVQDPEPELAGREYWERDWYGWWVITEATGNLEDKTGVTRDVCVRIRFSDEDSALLKMWDSGAGEDHHAFTVNTTLLESSDPRGVLNADSGGMNGSQLPRDSFRIDPAQEPYSSYPGLICFDGLYQDPRSPGNSFRYRVFLRPWGTLWEDLRRSGIEGMPYDNMLPPLYDKWYLPLLEAGMEMPERINVGVSS